MTTQVSNVVFVSKLKLKIIIKPCVISIRYSQCKKSLINLKEIKYENYFLSSKVIPLLELNGYFTTNLMNQEKLFGTKLVWLPKDTIKRNE